MDNSKGGFRLLWTQEGERIVVWFIAKHKVCRRRSHILTSLPFHWNSISYNITSLISRTECFTAGQAD